MSLMDDLNRAARSVMDFFFPRQCPFCGGIVGRELLCDKCRKTLPYTGEHAVVDGRFGSAKGKLGGLDCFGQLMAETAAEHFSGAFDAITWVPVSCERLRKRGYDQARLLAASVCVDWHVAPQETLRKTVDNPAQSGLSDAAERRANVLGVYEAVHPEEIRGKRFLLIDDVLTTGSTLAECARVLREAGAADVLCLTLAMTRGKK